MSLESIERAIHQVVRGELGVEEAAQTLGVDAQRLALYGNFARSHVHTAVTNVFEITHARLADEWEGLLEAYTQAYPPSHWALNIAAESFPEFLEALSAKGQIEPFEVVLAQFEWEQYAVLVDSGETTSPVSGMVLNPTLSLLELPYPVVPFVVAFENDPATPAPAEEPSLAILFRNPTSHNCIYRQGTDDLLLAIKIVHEGLSISAVSEVVGYPAEAIEAVIEDAVRIGLILRSEQAC